MNATQSDVVVVGGGVSGLVAARCLALRGLTSVVLEARDRVGGRTLSVKTGDGAIDLGGTWIGPRQKHIKALVQELGLRTFKQHASGRKLLLQAGKLRQYGGRVPWIAPWALLDLLVNTKRIERYAATVPLEAPWRATRAQAWDAITLEQWMSKNVPTASARFLFGNIARAILAAEPSEMSFLYFLNYIRVGHGIEEVAGTADGAQDERLVEGMQSVSLRLADELGSSVRLEAPVRAIEQDVDGVTVHSARGSHHAPLAIVCLPPPLLAHIDFTSPLPARRAEVATRMPMGSCIKYIATYERPFWREAGLSGDAVSDGGAILTVMDNCTHNTQVPALVAFAVGDAAKRWSQRSASERRSAVVRELARLFGAQAASPTTFHEMNWLAEPYSGGCYIAVPQPGDLTAIGDALRRPCGRIHWAGSETATVWPGVDGAVQSGQRAANEVVNRIATQENRHVASRVC